MGYQSHSEPKGETPSELIYVIIVVRDEGDIISESIKQYLKWADKIFVADNGSTDGTSAILKQLEQENDCVKYIAEFNCQFYEGLRGIIFNILVHRLDLPRPHWWCIGDADEVYFDDPRDFLRKVPPAYGRVCTNTIEFIQIQNHNKPLSPESYLQYVALEWSESRFLRDTPRLVWTDVLARWPRRCRAAFPARIRMLHFPFRSVEQIDRRIAIRADSRKKSGIPWHNSAFTSASQLLREYRCQQRIDIGVHSETWQFCAKSNNHLVGWKSKLKNSMKRLLYSAKLV